MRSHMLILFYSKLTYYFTLKKTLGGLKKKNSLFQKKNLIYLDRFDIRVFPSPNRQACSAEQEIWL